MTSEPRRILCEGPEAFTIWGNENIRSARQWGRLFHECGFSVSETRYSRHLLAELTGSRQAEKVLTSIPGAKFASIHVGFELDPREPDVVDDQGAVDLQSCFYACASTARKTKSPMASVPTIFSAGVSALAMSRVRQPSASTCSIAADSSSAASCIAKL